MLIKASDLLKEMKGLIPEEADVDSTGKVEMETTGPGGDDDHTHEYDPSKDGETSETNGHTHPYKFSDDTTGPASDGDHVHSLPEHDELEA